MGLSGQVDLKGGINDGPGAGGTYDPPADPTNEENYEDY